MFDIEHLFATFRHLSTAPDWKKKKVSRLSPAGSRAMAFGICGILQKSLPILTGHSEVSSLAEIHAGF